LLAGLLSQFKLPVGYGHFCENWEFELLQFSLAFSSTNTCVSAVASLSGTKLLL